MPFPTIAPSPQQLLRHSAEVAPDLRQRAIVLRFAEPLRASDLDAFMLIHLTPKMKAAGEAESYKPEIFQPHRVGNRLCPICYKSLTQIRPNAHRCTNPECRLEDGRPTAEVSFASGPLTGIISVNVQPSWIVAEIDEMVPCGLTWNARERKMMQNFHPRKMRLVSGCIVILDRRYDAITLSQVYRTCGILCEQRGWKLA